jgi:TPR repeat protein
MYFHGKDVPEDKQKAAELWGQAAAQGYAEAQCQLGGMYFDGKDVPEDKQKVAELWGQVAAQGNPHAQYQLGCMYFRGDGVPEDEQKATELWGQAAAQGHAEAQCQLGCMYFRGDGVPEDKQKGAELWGQAAAQGDAEAQGMLERLRAHETKEFEDARVQKQHVRDLLTEHRSLIPRGSEETAPQALQRNGEMRSEQLREARQVLSAVLRGMPEEAEALALDADVRKELGAHIVSMRAQEELSSLTTSFGS